MAECHCRGDMIIYIYIYIYIYIMAVLPRLELAAVDLVDAHACAKLCAAHAEKRTASTAARAEQTNTYLHVRERRDGLASQCEPQ